MHSLHESLERLIAFNSVSSNSDIPLIEYLSNFLDAEEFETKRQKVTINGTAQENLLAWTGPATPNGLIISGHVDTVPFERQPGWTRNPLRMSIEGDRIYGRGTSDMKGFIAQCLAAAPRIKSMNLKRPVVFAFTACEEVGLMGAELLAPKMAELLNFPVPTSAWIGEPTSFQVLNSHKSIAAFEVRITGKAGHSGQPELGVNAIAVMAKVINVIGAYQAELRSNRDPAFEQSFPDAPYDVLNFGTIRGGMASNMIAERCNLLVSYRSLPDRDPIEIYNEIARRIGTIDPRDFGSPEHRARIELTRPAIAPPLNSPRGTSLERVLLEVTGESTTRGALFGTDGGHFTSAHINSIVCGPGDFSQAHQPDESISRAAFEKGPDMIVNVIDKLCSH